VASPQQSHLLNGSIKSSNIAIYYRPFVFFTKIVMAIIFFLSLVFKYKEGGITITSFDPLLEFARFYRYKGFD
jgi:hypothetical protein